MEKEFEMDVYVLLNIDNEEYLDTDGNTEPSLYHAAWWQHKENAEQERMKCDEPDRFMIKKMKIKLEIVEDKNEENSFIVVCIDGMVDGVTGCKFYNVINEFVRDNIRYYGIEKDDYGIYNEFKAERFLKI